MNTNFRATTSVAGPLFPSGWLMARLARLAIGVLGGALIALVASAADEPSQKLERFETPHSPEPLAPARLAHFRTVPKPVTLPDGTLAAIFVDHKGQGMPPTPEQQTIYAAYSKDHGQTWSDFETLVELPSEAGGFGYYVPMVDQQGRIHVFLLCDANSGIVRPRRKGAPAGQRLDVWHTHSQKDLTQWTPPKCIWEGRSCDLLSATQLSNGRIVLPISYMVGRSWSNRGEGPDAFTYMGRFDTTVLYSDDGETFQQSESVIRVPTPNLSAYGAVEPAALELNDGRVWMLLRNQLGRFYETFSTDGGETWSRPAATAIRSSDSPASLTRLLDGRILMLWNNCQRHPYAQGSRHVLHGAISDDEGQSWHGYREVRRDPLRDVPPPPSGDHGASYPFVTQAHDGSIIFATFVQTGEGRSIDKFSLDWLLATSAHDDFSAGLERWSRFGTQGVELIPHPRHADQQVLSLSTKGDNWPTAAVWNFPSGDSGELRLTIQCQPDSAPLRIELTNHFSPPFDPESQFHSLFCLAVNNSAAADSIVLPPGEWSTLEFRWDCQAGSCRVEVDGHEVARLSQQHQGPGPSYLRLGLDSSSPTSGQILIGDVQVDVSRN